MKFYFDERKLREQAPEVFSPVPKYQGSKYEFIYTPDILNKFALEGWRIRTARQSAKGHLIRMWNPAVIDAELEKKEGIPEIVLINSYNGQAAFTLFFGFFRFACENGLIISDGDIFYKKLKHFTYNADKVNEVVEKTLEFIKNRKNFEIIYEMKERKVTKDEIEELAIKSAALRPVKKAKIDLKSLIEPRRKEDEEKNLWTAYNVIQEKLVNGGFWYEIKKEEKIIKRLARPLKDVKKITDINVKTFKFAKTFL